VLCGAKVAAENQPGFYFCLGEEAGNAQVQKNSTWVIKAEVGYFHYFVTGLHQVKYL